MPGMWRSGATPAATRASVRMGPLALRSRVRSRSKKAAAPAMPRTLLGQHGELLQERFDLGPGGDVVPPGGDAAVGGDQEHPRLGEVVVLEQPVGRSLVDLVLV